MGTGDRETQPHRTRRWVLAAGTVAAAVIIIGIAFVVTHRHHAPPPIPAPATVSGPFIAAWNERNWMAMAAFVTDPPPDFAATYAAMLSDLQATAATFTPGPVTTILGNATAPFTATITISGLGPWTYQGAIPLLLTKRAWSIEWSPAVVYPGLGPGDHLAFNRTMPTRAAVLAANGQPLAGVVDAAGLVGGVATATAAEAAVLGPPFKAGDDYGTSGLEATYNAQLAGKPDGSVVVVDAAHHPGPPLYHFIGVAPEPVTTTIDPAMQAVADRVLAPVSKNAALVAMNTTTGDVEAVISHPDGGYPRALVGTYPAGSTFKVITATAAIMDGFTPTTTVQCPPNIDVDGRSFTNAENETYGAISFEEAFAKSCNTAFIGTAEKITDAQLEAAASLYGINTAWPFPVAHYGGQLPTPLSPVEHAADAIGQGRVAVSPLEMCSIAAAVANGGWRPPQLVATTPPPAATPLPPTVTADLQLFMRAVVTSGTGTAADIGGVPVYGKTGTAEFGTATPPQTHAWFIGWRGTTAFAVIVEGGGFGGDVAAPLAAQFLSDLPG